jgi:hypothetical protein
VDLCCLFVTFKLDGLEMCVLYDRRDVRNPGTVSCRREVQTFARRGLQRTLEVVADGDVEMIGSSGFTTREVSPFLPSVSNNDQAAKGA